ncbi:MAG: cellulase family glycosylhydrolase [Verrucomicrobiota bacterium]
MHLLVLPRALIVLFLCLCASAASPAPATTQTLWAAPLPTDVDGRTALRITQNDASTSALRTFDVPVAGLRGKWIYLTAAVKSSALTARPQDWNGIKVMLKIDTPAGEQWPQIVSFPDGAFAWQTFSTRILIPTDATQLTLHLGLELVAGTAWFDDVRITPARETLDVPPAPRDRPVFRGHALPALRGAMAHPNMTHEDLRVFANEWGGNLIRWQLLHIPHQTPPHDYAAYDRWLDQALTKLDDVIRWSREFGVKVVVDLHSPPGGRVAREGAVATSSGDFWSTPAAQAHFVEVWRRIATRYRGEHDVIWGFDLLNEPDDRTVTPAGEDWQTLSARVARAIREIDPARTLIVEPATWGSPEGFAAFQPLDLPNIVYSFHVYSPFNYTHQGVDAPAEPLTYPGVIDGQPWDRAALEASLAPAVAFAQKHRVHLYVGEFSALRWAPGADRYLADAIAIFEKHGWDWSYHAYREWHGWNLELGPDRDDLTPTAEPGPRQQAVLRWMRKNQPATSGVKRFPADAVLDITAPPYGARPDDGADDTAAIQRAITDTVDTGRFIYFPAGTYDISDTLVSKNADGIWRAMVTLQGEQRERTILRLVDHAPGFGDPTKPKALLMTGSIMDPGEADTGGGGNKAFRNNILDLTIDTGRGNPGAIGIEWAASNWGSVKDVTIRSGDGTGHAGLSMRRNIPGPGYVKRVAIEGFDHGIDVGDMQYGFTLEHVLLRHQRKVGIRLDRNLLHIRRLTSDNTVPAIVTTHPESVLTLLDPDLRGTADGVNALDIGGNLLAKDVALEPAAPLRVRGDIIAPSDRLAWLTWPATTAPDHAWLPVEDAPDYWSHDFADWQAVGPRRDGEPDDTAAVQRAMDAGKPTVYFPIGRTYFVSDTITVRGAVRQVLGMGAEISLGAAEQPFSDAGNPRPLFRITATDHPEVWFEHLFFNAQYRGVVIFENDSPRTVVIRHSGGWIGTGQYRRSYVNTPRATGRLFVEDVFMSGWSFNDQDVWARQFNPENQDGDGIESQVRNTGGRLWILGFKTEGQAPFLLTARGATTELYGAYNYVSATHPPEVPADAVPYIVDHATAFLSFTTENFRDNDYSVYLRASRDDITAERTRSSMIPRNGASGYRSFFMPAFHTPGPAAP